MADIFEHDDTPRDILQRDWLEYLENRVEQEQWVTVYCCTRGQWGTTVFYCALIPNALVGQALGNPSWELLLGHGRPGCSVRGFGSDNQIVEYHRFGGEDGIEPLVFDRNFHGVRSDYVEVSEEFRLFHDLFHDVEHNRFVRFDDAGNEEEIIRISPERIKIRIRQLKQFLAIKEMHLAVYFSIDRSSGKTLQELGLSEMTSQHANVERNLVYRFGAYSSTLSSRGRRATTRLEGKKLIAPMPKEKCGIWPYEDESDVAYEDFVIGTDQNGEPIIHTCDPDKLANYFGKNPDSPHYLTPVFFRREVLGKYYARPELYSVEDGYLRCAGLWGLRLDNDHSKFVVVYLGDLGRDLPASERTYWKSFNVAPDGKISAVAWKRGFLGEFADPQSPELTFKHAFRRLQREWDEKYSWKLFVLNSDADESALAALHVPVTEERQEFEQQVMALGRVLIDSLNVSELTRRVSAGSGAKNPIARLEQFLRKRNSTGYEPHIRLLREFESLRQSTLGMVRTGAASHTTTRFDLSAGRARTVEQILQGGTELLDYLRRLAGDDSTADTTSGKGPGSRRKSRQPHRRSVEDVDLAIITILPEEHQAVARLIPDLRLHPGTDEDPNLYYWETGSIASANQGGVYRVVLAFAGSPGTNAGAIVTSETIEKWNPRYVLLVGVAGGLPPQELRKGDVVLSSHIWGYEYGKIEHGFRPRPDQQFGADGALLNCAVAFSGRNPQWMQRIDANCPESDFVPRVVCGPVASGDKVVDDIGDPFFSAVTQAWPKLQAVEMEGAGAGAAVKIARDKGRAIGFLMIRGISDMPPDFTTAAPQTGAQTAQRDTWKKYASACAATFAVRLVSEAWPVSPKVQR